MFSREAVLRNMRFAVTGICSLIAYYVVYIGWTEVTGQYLHASVIGFFAYWSTNFLLNKFWTFKNRGRGVAEACQHFAMHALNHVVVMMGGLYLLIEFAGFHPITAQVILTCVITVEVYILTHLIFKSPVR